MATTNASVSLEAAISEKICIMICRRDHQLSSYYNSWERQKTQSRSVTHHHVSELIFIQEISLVVLLNFVKRTAGIIYACCYVRSHFTEQKVSSSTRNSSTSLSQSRSLLLFEFLKPLTKNFIVDKNCSSVPVCSSYSYCKTEISDPRSYFGLK